eukprot:scaffold12816_cov126-Skeletonema_dohrnii-CCMP3373.AAC.8
MQCSQALDLRQQRALVSTGGQCNVLKLSCLRNENALDGQESDTGRTPGEHCLAKKKFIVKQFL